MFPDGTHRRARSRFRSAVTRPARVFRDSTGCTHSPLAAFHARQPLFVRTGRRRADLDNHNGPPHAQKRSQLQQRRRPVSQEGETRVVRGPEQGRSGVERQATRPGQRYAVERARKRAAVETSTRLVAPIERDAAPFFSSTSRIAAPCLKSARSNGLARFRVRARDEKHIHRSPRERQTRRRRSSVPPFLFAFPSFDT